MLCCNQYHFSARKGNMWPANSVGGNSTSDDLHIGLSRDPVYYAEVWQQRQEHSPKKQQRNSALLIRADSGIR